MGFRKVPGTTLKDGNGKVVYTPPQNALDIEKLMYNLESYINNDQLQEVDPLIKMAVIHFQFESIHPFYDGNGRTGRIINILYLVLKGLLDIPVLYLSRYIIDNKAEYYNLLQKVRDEEAYEEWVLWMLKGVQSTALSTLVIVKEIKALMNSFKIRLREETKFYNKELLDSLFKHPYTTITRFSDELNIHRNTASSRLNELVEKGYLDKIQLGKLNFFVNKELYQILAGDEK